MKTTSKNLIVVLGPTASGKTQLAIQLAKYFNTEIISADSRQFYREIGIGTAAPNTYQLAEVKHHFVGHLSVKDDYNVSRFEKDVLDRLKTLFQTKDVVVLVGGSGLYINAVCQGIDELPDPDKKLRQQLDDVLKKEGIKALQEKLRELDPDYYAQVDLANPKRLIRAIEVCLQTGKPYSLLRMNKPKKRDFNILKIGLEVPRRLLNERIDRRTDDMLKKGWIDEARSVYPLRHLNALNTVGYKELFTYFDEEWDLEMAVKKIKTNTRRYAKRQMTWFGKSNDINWFSPEKEEEIIKFLKREVLNAC